MDAKLGDITVCTICNEACVGHENCIRDHKLAEEGMVQSLRKDKFEAAVAAAATMRDDGAASDFFFPVANGGSLERRPPRSSVGAATRISRRLPAPDGQRYAPCGGVGRLPKVRRPGVHPPSEGL